MRTITIFGSSAPKPGDTEYELAYKTGFLLGQKGYRVCIGGYFGIMEAASKGAIDSGSSAIGITVPLFSSMPNNYLSENVECGNLFDRITKLVELGDAYITLTGGTGTLLELAVIWEYMNKKIMPEKPSAVIGEFWNPLLSFMDERMESEGRKPGMIKQFTTPEMCVEYIEKHLRESS